MYRFLVIMWSGGFRERFHTPLLLLEQTLPRECYEVIWIEYFHHRPAPLLPCVKRGLRLETMNGLAPWHVGKLVNEAVRRTTGEILVVLDADVVVRPTFLESILRVYDASSSDRLYIHMQRWDEIEPTTGGSTDYDVLRRVCVYHNPRNYGGCLTVPRKWFYTINGYEEGSDFQRASAVGMDAFTRLGNLGLDHRWHPTEFMMHPYHEGTGLGSAVEKSRLRRQMDLIRYRRENHIFRANEDRDLFPGAEKEYPWETEV